MPSVERHPIPGLPASVGTALAELDGMTTVVVSRKGAKSYEKLQEVVVCPTALETQAAVARVVKTSVDDKGDGYFAVEQPGTFKRISWYAFSPVAGALLAPSVENEWQRIAGAWEKFAGGVHEHLEAERVHSLDLGKQIPKIITAVRKDHRTSMRELRRAAESTNEATTAALQNDYKTQRLKLGKELFESWMAKDEKRDATIVGVLSNVAGACTSDDYARIRNDEVGKQLWEAKTLSDLRTYGTALAERVQSGALKLEAASLEKLMPLIEKFKKGAAAGPSPSNAALPAADETKH